MSIHRELIEKDKMLSSNMVSDKSLLTNLIANYWSLGSMIYNEVEITLPQFINVLTKEIEQ